MAGGSLRDQRVLIVGAGPAGIRAAECLVRHGLRPTVIDEQPRGGGQIYRRPPDHAGFVRSARALYGFEAAKAEAVHQAFDSIVGAIDYRPETLAWDISDGAVWTERQGTIQRLAFDALILATGAMDRIIPFPGWTRPGVFSLGGAQVALKWQGCAIGRRTVFVGTGPLLYLVAYQYAKAGAEVAAVLDTSTFAAKRRALAGLVRLPAILAKGLYYMAWLRGRGVRIEHAVTPICAEGDQRVTAFRYRSANGTDLVIPCDAIALGYGLKSETQLVGLAGCRFVWDESGQQWLPEMDAVGRAVGRPEVYLAGDGAGIAGADAAELRGALSALAFLTDQGTVGAGSERVSELRRKLNNINVFRKHLEAAFPFPRALASGLSDDTILCRCEAVTAGELRRSASESDATELNRAKAYSRLGMGRCQGRICGPAAACVLAAKLGVPLEQVGRLRPQPPVKPIAVAAMASPALP
jgi:NADPH-dependent 2,4-dienoyl-CoA reductase/sulfur reductase-like enzyme